jgi:hypothetical protein
VRVTRDGVTAHTRRGYRAPRAEETSVRDRPSAVAPAVATSRSATPEALGKLVEFRSDEAFRMQAIAGISAAAPRQIWVLGEIAYRMAQTSDWRNGASAVVMVSNDGETLSKQEITIEPGERTFLASIEAPADPGAYLVQVQLVAASGGGQKTLADAERVTISGRAGPDSPQIQQALLFRRGPSTGPGYLPTADVRFRRNESVRVAAPVAPTATAPSIRLLGRNGSLIDVPIEASIADAPSPGAAPSPSGSSWLVGQTRLAPLAAGEYVLELRVDVEGDPHKVQVPLRVIP